MSIYEKFEAVNFENIKTYSLKERPSKVTVENFSQAPAESDNLKEFLGKLPDILAVKSLREIAAQIRRAKNLGKPIVWGIGGHVVKTGLAPVLVDLMRRGFVSAIAANGSVLVHDAEIALVGFTSEDVDASLGAGDFGAARETGELLNQAAKTALRQNFGLGEAMGGELIAAKPENENFSLLAQAYRNKIPFTAHLTIGADIGHFHPTADGAALGAASHADFRLFCAIVRELNEGGVYLNIGSAVVLPEIFLKAVTVIRNLGFPLANFTTANFDFIQSYRPLTNVVRRPVQNGGGRGFSITGHHEIMIPLLAAQIICGN
jgi:hypothetical protein